jgi:hypothetical protein
MNKGEQMNIQLHALDKLIGGSLNYDDFVFPKIFNSDKIDSFGKYMIPLDIIVINEKLSSNKNWGYVTLMHELIHSTGHKDRLDRPSLYNIKHKVQDRVDILHEEILAHAGCLVLLWNVLDQSKRSDLFFLLKRDIRSLKDIPILDTTLYLEDNIIQDLTDVCEYLCSDFDKKVLRNVQKIMKGVTI